MQTIQELDPEGKYSFTKKENGDSIYWLDAYDRKGVFLFSFDKKIVFNLFSDYPAQLTAKQKDTFDRENPYWKEFFKDRKVT